MTDDPKTAEGRVARAEARSGRPESWTERRGRARAAWTLPFHRFEWFFEHLNYTLSQWAFVKFLDQAGRFTILIVVILWIIGKGDRDRERYYQAWQVINTAEGRGGDGGRRLALEDLNANGISLNEVDLSHANISDANLVWAELAFAKFDTATCLRCTFTHAYLSLARFSGAWLSGADFSRASANQSNFRLLDSEQVKFTESNLMDADFWGARLEGADFSYSILWDANLECTNLEAATFEGADLRGVRLGGARNWRAITSLRNANVAELVGPPRGFLAWAVDTMGAVADSSTARSRRHAQRPPGNPERWTTAVAHGVGRTIWEAFDHEWQEYQRIRTGVRGLWASEEPMDSAAHSSLCATSEARR